jgi:CheY-like chemotaxis protein
MVAVIQSNETPRRRALVVDDSRIARHVLSGLLDRLGFEVETVDSAEAALNRLSGNLPDVVFMDHLLPGMQGLEAVRKLRARIDRTSMRIVMYTSQDGELFADVARDAGADDIFVKTSKSGALDAILQRLDLLPRGTGVQRRRANNVVPLPSTREVIETRASLEALLEPILDLHREKIRQDLLSEFAIMERYEERMRRDTMLRIDNMTKQAIASINRSILERERMQEQRAESRKRAWLPAAGFIVALSIGLAAGFMS